MSADTDGTNWREVWDVFTVCGWTRVFHTYWHYELMHMLMHIHVWGDTNIKNRSLTLCIIDLRTVAVFQTFFKDAWRPTNPSASQVQSPQEDAHEERPTQY